MTKTIIITGASSGLGKAIAEHVATLGITLYLIGRNKQRLEETASICKAKNANAIPYIADVSSLEEMLKFYDHLKGRQIDILFACAAVSMDVDGVEKLAQAKKIFDINIAGLSNTVLPAAEIMSKKNVGGKIVIIGSLAGELPFPTSPSYCASKAAARIFADSLRIGLKKYNIQITTVLPGYIATPMTNNNKHTMPFIVSASNAAKLIVSGVNKNKDLIIFPKILYYLVQVIKLLPNCMSDYLLGFVPGKE